MTSFSEEAPHRFVCMRQGEVIHPPGPLPYFWMDPEDKTKYCMHALTEEERAALGWKEVEQRKWFQHDPEIHTPNAPKMILEGEHVAEEHTYDFQPGAWQAMLKRIDEKAEATRQGLMTPGDLQVFEYRDTLAEAQEVAAMSEADHDEIGIGDYPMLDASQGVDYDEDLGREVYTIAEAAYLILKKHAAYKDKAGYIRSRRLTAKKEIREAESIEEAYERFMFHMTRF